VAGTPGTAPTNWVNAQLVGLSRQISLGTENGLPYIDLRFFGTGNATDNLRIDLEGTTQIAAANGQTWAYSLNAKAISGTIPLASFIFFERSILGSTVTVGGSNFTPTSTLTRFNSIRTLNGGATVAFVQPSLFFAIVNGTTYDFTIRIAAPQMELGAYATTFIPTTTAAVTRLADAASKTGISSLIGQTEGTILLDVENVVANSFLMSFNESTTAGVSIIKNPSNQIQCQVWGSALITILSSVVANTRLKIGFAYKSGSTAVYINGTQIGVSSTAFTFNAALDTLFLPRRTYYSVSETANINQAALFPTRLTNAQLAEITTL
jgi:hypothetical protein